MKGKEMPENEIQHAAPVPPFVTFVASAVPMVFDNSMSYYEALCALWKWLQDDVINVINNNASVTEQYIEYDLHTRELFIELKNYVDTYFDNLDVQDEINNKLDAMVEAGTLQEIITTYIQANVAWTFDTVADMKLSTNLVNGSYARTLGFHTLNDGGGALYYINNSGVADDRSIIAIDDLRAHLVLDKVVSPEQFGAYGDGIHDDTDSWQDAVNSGHDVKAMHKTYLTGKIEVTEDIAIDCNYASFTCNEDTLFDIKGEVSATITGESNYAAHNQNYHIANGSYDNYTGFAVFEGDNNFQESRAYYMGGFTAYFKSGKLDGAYPIPVTNPTITLVNPIKGSLKNIGDITHTSPSTSTISINVLYGYGYKIENVKNDSSVCYKCIQLSKCLNCICDNLTITQHFESDTNNSYIVDFDDSSFCSVLNSTLHNDLWHTITTGGAILCYSNLVQNCHMSSYNQYAYLDHDNARGTTVKDCTTTCIGVSGLSTIDNVIINANYDSNKRCMVRLSLTSEEENAIYNLTNCKLMPNSDTSSTYCGIQLSMQSPQVSGKTYYVHSVNIDNFKTIGSVASSVLIGVDADSFGVIGNININNSNINFNGKSSSHTYVDISNAKCTITNCNDKVTTHFVNVGGTAYVWNEINVINSNLWRLNGNYTTVFLDNVTFETAPTGASTTITNLYGGNLKSFIRQDCILACTNVLISSMQRTTNDKWFNICNTASAKYYQHISGTSMTTEEVTYS